MNNNTALNLEEKQSANSTKLSVMDCIKAIGPAAIIAAVIIGPGTVTTASIVGATYEYQAIWVLVLAVAFAYFYQEPAIRITLNKNTSIVEAVREKIGPKVSIFLYIVVLMGAIAFQAGNFLGASMAMNYFIPDVSLIAWTLTMSTTGLVIAWFSAYNILENFTKFLISLMVAAFALTALFSGPSITDVISKGFSFHIPGNNYILVLALLATTMPPDIPLSLSALLKEKYSPKADNRNVGVKVKFAHADLAVSMVITGIITISIIICSGTLLFPEGIVIKSAADMAKQLTPLLGRYAGILFSLGLWAAGFSSGLFRISLSAMLFNQAFGYEEDMKATRSRIIMVISSVLPVLIVAMFDSMPVQLIVTAQALNGIALPVVTAIIWKLSNDKSFLGEFANNKRNNVIYLILMVLVSILAIKVFLGLFGVI